MIYPWSVHAGCSQTASACPQRCASRGPPLCSSHTVKWGWPAGSSLCWPFGLFWRWLQCLPFSKRETSLLVSITFWRQERVGGLWQQPQLSAPMDAANLWYPRSSWLLLCQNADGCYTEVEQNWTACLCAIWRCSWFPLSFLLLAVCRGRETLWWSHTKMIWAKQLPHTGDREPWYFAEEEKC